MPEKRMHPGVPCLRRPRRIKREGEKTTFDEKKGIKSSKQYLAGDRIPRLERGATFDRDRASGSNRYQTLRHTKRRKKLVP